jgi:hypothetical protein
MAMPDVSPSLTSVLEKMGELDCDVAVVKVLAQNDNSKNQPYLARGDFQILNMFPHGEMTSEAATGGMNLKAPLNFSWLDNELRHSVAPETKLILYPRHNEIRISGFLSKCATAPRSYMQPRRSGYTIPRRMWIFGISHRSGRIYAFLVVDGTPVYAELSQSLPLYPSRGVLIDITTLLPAENRSTKQQLLSRLLEISQLGFISSRSLGADGLPCPCNGTNCGGLTLEAELGIQPNSKSEPDYLGWEVKQHALKNLTNLSNRLLNKGTAITLMTPQPTGGVYAEDGIEQFIRRYGYPDKKGRVGRLNFGGVHLYGLISKSTRLELATEGFTPQTGAVDISGSVLLVRDDEQRVAAKWKFIDLLKHWSLKHAKAVYVPSQIQRQPSQAYRYGDVVRLGEGTDFVRFLKAIHGRSVYYDPGIKLEDEAGIARAKHRNQFRIKSGDLPCLYEQMTVQSLIPTPPP